MGSPPGLRVCVASEVFAVAVVVVVAVDLTENGKWHGCPTKNLMSLGLHSE
jgi:hypothetical protein